MDTLKSGWYIMLAHTSSSGKESISTHTENQTSPHGYCMHGCGVTTSAHATNQTLFFRSLHPLNMLRLSQNTATGKQPNTAQLIGTISEGHFD